MQNLVFSGSIIVELFLGLLVFVIILVVYFSFLPTNKIQIIVENVVKILKALKLWGDININKK